MAETFHILMADDDEDDRSLFRDVAKSISDQIIVQTVKDGKELMERLKKPNTPEPKVIFLDLNMPFKNGKECLDEIRSDENLLHLPIAIFSTSNSKKDIDETFNKGADLYIQKPNDYGDLKKIIIKVMDIDWDAGKQRPSKNDFILSV